MAALPTSLGAQAEPARDEELRAFEHHRGEGTIEDVVDAALRLARLDPRRFDEARDRARLAGLLPQIRVGVQRGAGLGLTLRQSADVLTNGYTSDDSLTLVAQLMFRFDRVAYAPEESGLWREAREVQRERWTFVESLVRLYFERRRLQLEEERERRRGAPLDLARAARIEELGAVLDFASDGALRRRP